MLLNSENEQEIVERACGGERTAVIKVSRWLCKLIHFEVTDKDLHVVIHGTQSRFASRAV